MMSWRVEAYSLPARKALSDNDGWWWKWLLMMTCWWYCASLACHHYIFMSSCAGLEINELLYYISLCLSVFNLNAEYEEDGWRIILSDARCWSFCKMWFSIARHDLLVGSFILFAYNVLLLILFISLSVCKSWKKWAYLLYEFVFIRFYLMKAAHQEAC